MDVFNRIRPWAIALAVGASLTIAGPTLGGKEHKDRHDDDHGQWHGALGDDRPKSARLTERAVFELRAVGARTIGEFLWIEFWGQWALQWMDWADESDQEIDDAAAKINDWLEKRAEFGLDRAEKVRDRALDQLDKHDGTDAQMARVVRLHDRVAVRVSDAREDAEQAILEAAEDAKED